MPDARADDLEQLAQFISAIETREGKQREKARMLLEWEGKKTARTPQRAPGGLFAQKQEQLL